MDSKCTYAATSCPLEVTETPAIQGPYSTPYEVYTHIPVTISQALSLPRELVERILLLLDTEFMLICRLVNREFNDIIQSSVLLQYSLACKAAGVIDNPESPLSSAERLEALLKREQAWRNLKPVFETTIKVNHQLYELTGGKLFLAITIRRICIIIISLHPLKIIRDGPGQNWSGDMGDISMAVYEHDLIVNVIFSEVGNQADIQRYSLDLVFVKLSTGEYHPLARHPQIHLQRSFSVRPIVLLTLVGDNLALIVYGQDGTFPDKLLIYDWKTGHKRLQHEAFDNATYASPVFVSPDLLLVPNLTQSHFEVWHLPRSHPNPKPPVQILSIKLPTLSDDYSLLDVHCRGEPNPFLHSMQYFPLRPFFSSPEDSIIMANLRLVSMGFQNVFYTLIMHRLDPDDGSVRFDALSVAMMPHPRSDPQTRDPLTSPQSHISTECGSSSIYSGSSTTSPTSRYDFPRIQWANWGPPISQWFQVNEPHAWWITQCTGQRCVFSDRNPRDRRKLMVSVADFNPYNVKRHADMTVRPRGSEGEGNDGNGKKENGKEEEEEEFELLDHEGVFAEEVYMGLECVVYHSPDEYDFDIVLMDEERLLGLKLNHERRVESVKVLYFG